MKMTCLSIRVLAALLLFCAAGATARATVAGSASLSLTNSGDSNTYNVTLQNSSTAGESIANFLFAGTSSQNYMAVAPTNVIAPSGWSFSIIHSGGADGYAIKFFPLTTSMPAGTSLSGFRFQTTSTLADFRGTSVFYPSVQVMTSEVRGSLTTVGTSFVGVVQDPFSGSPLGGGWYFSPWFGTYNETYFPWIYKTDLGFLYVDVSNTTDFYLFVQSGVNGGSLGWIFTNQSVWPNVYSFSNISWLYYPFSGVYFYNYSTQRWEIF